MNIEAVSGTLADRLAKAIWQSGYVQVEVSAKHVHLSQKDLEALFGKGAVLRPKRALSQPGQYLSEQRVTLIGPKGRKENVAVLGPVRPCTQVELSVSDAVALGVDARLRESGDIRGTAGISLEGPGGMLTIREGVIVARSHIHMTPEHAGWLGVKDKQRVSVEIGGERPVTFRDVIVRVSPDFRFRMHIDYDEANAAAVGKFALGRIIV